MQVVRYLTMELVSSIRYLTMELVSSMCPILKDLIPKAHLCLHAGCKTAGVCRLLKGCSGSEASPGNTGYEVGIHPGCENLTGAALIRCPDKSSSNCSSNQFVYTISDVAPDIMRSNIQYAYSKQITITYGNVQDLSEAAEYLSVSDIVQLCKQFIEKQLCQENFCEMTRLDRKGRELADMMERRKVDILCVQETRWKGSKARSIGAGFKLFYYGVDSKRNGVGVVLKEEFVRNVLEVGCELEEKERFWSELDEVMESIPTGDEEVMGKFGVKERNLEGQMVVDFAKRMDMGVVNTYFQKREEHRVTYKSGGRRTQIEKKTKWWKLKKEECSEVIRETGRKVLGVSSGRRKEDKETWWWNEEVQDSIQRKRLAKKKWDMDRTEENRQEYKELQRRVKRKVSKAKQKAYDELYTRLDTREGEKDLYRLARQRDRDGKDVQQVRVIKDRDGRVLTSEESVQRRWKEYFEELMNEENEREKRVEGVNSVEQKVDKIRKDEVRKALKRMKSGKAVGPDDIPVEVWKCLGEAAVEFLANLFNRVLENLEKAYDRVPREELWYCMRKSGVAEKYVRVVQDMYERSRTVVRCAVVMDQLSEEVRQESPWTMMFADNIVICSESREQVEENLERWRFALERRGMKVSGSKTEYMCVNEREGSGTVRLQGEEVKKVQEFKYLGSTVQSNGECGKESAKAVLKESTHYTNVAFGMHSEAR
ncbi:hypothetical protein QTP70_012888 [Hemibagrus guttatus]|uniref:ribonuclease H n=1 Tax=Hemibagrus guttatus TaxID=175788 RepID=A0AAE0RH07_9TELE|nr:hypothetical protein QTP70_012888 [Hemibagrus guttatus]